MVNTMQSTTEFDNICCAAHSLQQVFAAGLHHPEMAKAFQKVRPGNLFYPIPSEAILAATPA